MEGEAEDVCHSSGAEDSDLSIEIMRGEEQLTGYQ